MAYERYRLLVDHEVPEYGCDGEPTGHMLTARAGDVFEVVPDPLCAARNVRGAGMLALASMAAVLVPLGLVCWVAMGEVRRCG